MAPRLLPPSFFSLVSSVSRGPIGIRGRSLEAPPRRILAARRCHEDLERVEEQERG